MDYEKKYKEALERAKQVYKTPYTAHWDVMKELIEHLFPELKESEDANIRGAIIDYLKDNNLTEWAAWLEKQGEPKSTSWKPTKEQYEALDYAYNCCPDTELGNHFEGVLSNLIDELHKLENQIEQKPADMVEPKFKVGDWVIFNNHHGSIYQVEKIEKYRYCLRHYLGGSLSIRYDTDLIRLWTIQDAEDGDVLAGEYDDYKKPWVGIFKCISENRPQRQFDSYCFIISSRHGFITPDSCDFYNFCKGHTIRYTKPATKEQRDMLFQKMHEAGYEWDAERKELKELSPSEVTKIDDQEQKPAWSAEDEERYLSCLKRLGTGDIRQPETINTVWLKSVKNRIQPKQEWSEEDEAMFQGVIETEQYMLDVVYGRKNFSVGNESIKEECAKELAWLKSLKDRIK